ncbi:MAG: 2Fe-2S iron-sulfur cluster-binding protein, partial [Acidimicrobiia bacterium]
MKITIRLNGVERRLACEPHESLKTVLRREGYYSVRFGSESGETGAAAVLVDGKLMSAEILLAAQADGHTVETVEGLAPGRGLDPIQEAFIVTGAIQSGYSTPAMILGTKALLSANPDPSEEEVRDMLTGILDRETGYVRPVAAVMRAAAVLRGEEVEPVEAWLVPALTGPEAEGPADMTSPLAGVPAAAALVIPSPEVPETSVVGKPERKVDAIKLAKGRPAFTDDFEMRGMLFAKMLYSPHAHARITSIDDSKARALTGVHAVLHHENTERVRYASGGQSYPNPLPYDQVSFDNKVRFVGDRVAVVAADSIEIAEEAVSLIEVTYEVLPAVFDELDAISGDAPIIHDE